MCRVATSDPRGGGDRTLRTVGVVALLVLAASALQARRGLDWEAISDPPEVQRAEPAVRTSDPRGDSGRPIDVQGSWLPLLLAGAVLLVVAAAGRAAAARREAARRSDEADVDDDQAVRLETAVAAAQEQLAAHADARAAIVAAYVAMAASLSAGLARVAAPGAAARPSDTPTELLTRAVRSGLVSPGPATTLTDLFREARFSRHPMGPAQRRSHRV